MTYTCILSSRHIRYCHGYLNRNAYNDILNPAGSRGSLREHVQNVKVSGFSVRYFINVFRWTLNAITYLVIGSGIGLRLGLGLRLRLGLELGLWLGVGLGIR